jgi:L-asparaginase II
MPRAPEDPVPLAVVTRGPAVESRHLGAVAVALPDGRAWCAGPADELCWARSAVKPLQAIPVVELGIADALGLEDAELAVICASHDGTERHVEVVDRILHRAGLDRERLQCGPHAPFDRRSSLAIARKGQKPERIHNNCSGKHAGFLLVARALGAPLDGYLDPQAPGQVLVREIVGDLAGIAADEIRTAVDGCGAPTLGISLPTLARAFQRMVNPDGLAAVRRSACLRLLAAVTNAPFYLAGDGRLETELVVSAPGRILPKCGAEGVYAVGAVTPAGPIGLAVKVLDGAERGYQPAVVRLLAALGLWESVPAALERFLGIPVYNTQKRNVGEVRCALEVPADW